MADYQFPTIEGREHCGPASSAYITNQLLRTLRVIDRERNPKEDPNAPAEFIFDAPRPDRTEQPEPQLTYADVRT